MVDLHSHILPGVDDGAADLDVALDMAATAIEDGIRVMVATPHVNYEYALTPDDIGVRVGELNLSLGSRGIPLAVVPGAEIAITRTAELDDAALRQMTIGVGNYVLLEAPLTGAAPFLEEAVFGLEARGFRTILAHPERSPIFQRDPDRLARLVERGTLCSITAASMTGRFGRTVRRFTLQLLRDGLVHNVASDAHDNRSRRPELRAGFEAVRKELEGVCDQIDWYTSDVPAAVMSGDDPPPKPEAPASRSGRLRRVIARRRR